MNKFWSLLHRLLNGVDSHVEVILTDVRSLAKRLEAFEEVAAAKATKLVVKSSTLSETHAATIERLNQSHASQQNAITTQVAHLDSQVSVAKDSKAKLMAIGSW